jgi:signal peptidase II
MRKRAMGLMVFLLVVDQWSKWLILEQADPAGHPWEITSFFNIHLTWNKGISFGLFDHWQYAPWIFSGVALVIVAVLLWWLREAENRMVAYGIGLVISGAIGNTIDRIRFGAVVDFLDFHIDSLHWPAFNIADSAIFLGVFALLCEGLFKGKVEKSVGTKDVSHEKNA